MRARVGLALTIAGAFLMISAPAQAKMARNDLGCHGSATITDDAGGSYSINEESATVEVPAKGSAAWSASTDRVSKNHSGSIWVQIGPIRRTIDTWASSNRRGKPGTSGTKTYEIPDWVPGVTVRVGGEHVAAGGDGAQPGTCAGEVQLTLPGGAFGSPIGIGVVAASAMALGGVVAAGFAHPVLGGISGLLFGVLAVADLSLFGVRAPDGLSVIGAPVVGLAAGIGLGVIAPFAGAAGAKLAAGVGAPDAPPPPPPPPPDPGS